MQKVQCNSKAVVSRELQACFWLPKGTSIRLPTFAFVWHIHSPGPKVFDAEDRTLRLQLSVTVDWLCLAHGESLSPGSTWDGGLSSARHPALSSALNPPGPQVSTGLGLTFWDCELWYVMNYD